MGLQTRDELKSRFINGARPNQDDFWSVFDSYVHQEDAVPVTWDSLSGKPTFSSVALTGAYADLTGKPILFSGAYADLSGKPTLFSGAWADLTGKPTFAAVATSGAYADLSGKPTLFSGAWADITGKPTFAAVATSGAYADLSGKPTLFTGSGTTGKIAKFTAAGAVGDSLLSDDGSGILLGATVSAADKMTIQGSNATLPIHIITTTDNGTAGNPMQRLVAAGSTNPTRMVSWMVPGKADWGVTLGNEGVPNMYFGGAGNYWFWRANWRETGIASNTFKIANEYDSASLGLTSLNVKAITGQTGNLIAATTVAGVVGDLFVVDINGSVSMGNPNTIPSAQIRMASTTKGFLKNVHTTTSKNAISSPATGLEVFDSVLGAPEYYNGSVWTGAWNRRGNLGTTAGTDFIGTTDAQDFVVKRNNGEVGRFVSYGFLTPAINAGSNTITGTTNSAIGSSHVITSGAQYGGIFGGNGNTANATAFVYGMFGGSGNKIQGANNATVGGAGNNNYGAARCVSINGNGNFIDNGAQDCVSIGNAWIDGVQKAIAIGYYAYAQHNGAMVLADGQTIGYMTSNTTDAFVSKFLNGYRFNLAYNVNAMQIASNGNVSIGGSTPDASALLDLSSTTKGFGLPSMTTTQINAIPSPKAGLMAFNSTISLPVFYNGSSWRRVTDAAM